jgi:16S rRNA (guanine527-N7)-methyltransferase
MPPDVAIRGRIEDLCRELGLAVGATQVDALAGFLALLQRWNATYNLTAVREPEQMLRQHLADCLAVVAPLERQLGDPRRPRLLDVGSGGGLPGAVLAIMLPGLDVTCVDAVGKKAAFTRQAAAELKLPNLHAEHARVESLELPSFDVIASRAFASLSDFVVGSCHQLAEAGIWMAMKGKRPDDEIAALPPDLEVFHVEPLLVPGLNAERCIVWMRARQVRAHN